MKTAAPRSSNTIETVVEVGRPRELKKSNKRMSVNITAVNINMISSKLNSLGLKIPFLATSIKPLENSAPSATPKPASTMMVLKDIAFEPTAEFKKLTASLLTPTIKSPIARMPRTITKIKYRFSIFKNEFQVVISKIKNLQNKLILQMLNHFEILIYDLKCI